jgi:hypothetical protein
MIKARHVSALPAVSKNTGWSYSWSLAVGDAATPASLPDGALAKLSLGLRGAATEIDCDAYVSRDGAVIRVEVPRDVTETDAWAPGSYDGQLRVLDPDQPVDLWEVLFVLPVVEGIGE